MIFDLFIKNMKMQHLPSSLKEHLIDIKEENLLAEFWKT